jgi:hypothetical protein
LGNRRRVRGVLRGVTARRAPAGAGAPLLTPLEAAALAVVGALAAGILTAGCLAAGGLEPAQPTATECRSMWIEYRNSAELLDTDEAAFVASCTRSGN